MHMRENEPLSAHTTFRIGGPAKYYLVPESKAEVREGLAFANEKNLPWLVIGKGSNLLVPDEGYSGVVIEIGKGMEKIEVETGETDGRICAQAGVSLGVLAAAAAKESLTGLEFASGIPGTLGGAVTMNAGAYDGEMKDVIVSATVLDKSGEERTLSREQLQLGYRSSRIQREGSLVLEAVFELQKGDREVILEKMRELNGRRRDKQPLEYPSAGSTFKRPEGYFAGKLIQDAGLRGFRIGDAQVSEKHCGFVINRGNATAADVRRLIKEVQKRVQESSGVWLEPEVKMIQPEKE